MSDEFWRQWPPFSASWAAGAAAGTGSGEPGPAGGAFAPYAKVAERFRDAVERFASARAGDPAQAADALGQFLREQFGLPSSLANVGPGFAPPPFASVDWQALGPGREQQQRWQRMNDAGARVVQAQARLQSLWGDAIGTAAHEFTAGLAQRSLQPDDPEAWREVYEAWIDAAERRYSQLAREPAYCEAQTELINAGSQWRHEARSQLEQWCKWLDLPTRSEFNSLLQRFKALEQSMQAMRMSSGAGSGSE